MRWRGKIEHVRVCARAPHVCVAGQAELKRAVPGAVSNALAASRAHARGLCARGERGELRRTISMSHSSKYLGHNWTMRPPISRISNAPFAPLGRAMFTISESTPICTTRHALRRPRGSSGDAAAEMQQCASCPSGAQTRARWRVLCALLAAALRLGAPRPGLNLRQATAIRHNHCDHLHDTVSRPRRSSETRRRRPHSRRICRMSCDFPAPSMPSTSTLHGSTPPLPPRLICSAVFFVLLFKTEAKPVARTARRQAAPSHGSAGTCTLTRGVDLGHRRPT